MRAGDADDAPDVALKPHSYDEVEALIGLCVEHHVALVPFGGGTSVVGGLAASADGLAGVAALDLCHLNQLIAIDPISQTATLGAGLLGPAAEELLAAEGFTLDLGRAPSTAAGPDVRQLILGSGGAFGVITSVTVRVRPLPQAKRYESW